MNRVLSLLLMLAFVGIEAAPAGVNQANAQFDDALNAYKANKTPATIRNLIDTYNVASSWKKSHIWINNRLGGITISQLQAEIVRLTPEAQKDYVEETERVIKLIGEILQDSEDAAAPGAAKEIERINQEARKIQEEYRDTTDLEAALRELERLRQEARARATESQRQQDAARQAAENAERYERVITDEIEKIVLKARTPAEKSQYEAAAKKIQDKYRTAKDILSALGDLAKLMDELDKAIGSGSSQQDDADTKLAAEIAAYVAQAKKLESEVIASKNTTRTQYDAFLDRYNTLSDKAHAYSTQSWTDSTHPKSHAAYNDFITVLKSIETRLNAIDSVLDIDDADAKLATEVGTYVDLAKKLSAEITTALKNPTQSQVDAFGDRYDTLNAKAHAYETQGLVKQESKYPKSSKAYTEYVTLLANIHESLNAMDMAIALAANAADAANKDAALEAEINSKLNTPANNLKASLPAAATVTTAQLNAAINEYNALAKLEPSYQSRVSSTTPRALKAFNTFASTLDALSQQIDALKLAAAENAKGAAAEMLDTELTGEIDALAVQAVALKTELLAVKNPTLAQLDAFNTRYKTLDSKAGAYAYLAQGSNNSPKATKAYATLRSTLDAAKSQLDALYNALDNAAVAALTALENDYATLEKQFANMGSLSDAAFNNLIPTWNTFTGRFPAVGSAINNMHNNALNQQSVARYTTLHGKADALSSKIKDESARRDALAQQQNDLGNIYDAELAALLPSLAAIETRAASVTASTYAQLKSDWDALKAKIAPYAAKINNLPSTSIGKTAAYNRYSGIAARADAIDQKLAQASSSFGILTELDALVAEAKTIELRASNITAANLEKLTLDYITLTEKANDYAPRITALPTGSTKTDATSKYSDIGTRLQNAAAKIAAAQKKFSDPTVILVQYMTVYRNLAELVQKGLTSANVKTAETMLTQLLAYGNALAPFDADIKSDHFNKTTLIKPNTDSQKQTSYIIERGAYVKIPPTEIQAIQDRIEAAK